jgi:hypothetical protein
MKKLANDWVLLAKKDIKSALLIIERRKNTKRIELTTSIIRHKMLYGLNNLLFEP